MSSWETRKTLLGQSCRRRSSTGPRPSIMPLRNLFHPYPFPYNQNYQHEQFQDHRDRRIPPPVARNPMSNRNFSDRNKSSVRFPPPPPPTTPVQIWESPLGSPLLTDQQHNEIIQVKEQIIQCLERSNQAQLDKIKEFEALVKTKSNEVSVSTQLIASFRMNIEDLNATIKYKDVQIQELEHNAQLAKTNIGERELQFAQANVTEIINLQSQLKEKESEINELKNKKVKLQVSVADTVKQDNIIASLKKNLNKKQLMIDELKLKLSKNDAQKHNIQILESKLFQKKSEINDLTFRQRRFEEMEIEIEKLKSDLVVQETELEDLKRRQKIFEAMEIELEILRRGVVAQETEFQELKRKEANFEALKFENENLQRKFEINLSAIKALKHEEQEIENLQKKLDEKELELRFQKSDELFFKSKIEKLKVDLDKKESEILRLKLQLEESTLALASSLKNENLQVKKERRDSGIEEVEEPNEEIKSLKLQIENLDKELYNKQLEMDEMKSKFNLEVKHLNKEFSDVKKLLAILPQETQINAETVLSLYEHVKSLKTQVIEFFKKQGDNIQNLESENKSCVQEIFGLQAKVARYENMIDSIQDKLTHVQFYKEKYEATQDRFECFTNNLESEIGMLQAKFQNEKLVICYDDDGRVISQDGGKVDYQILQDHLQKLNELLLYGGFDTKIPNMKLQESSEETQTPELNDSESEGSHYYEHEAQEIQMDVDPPKQVKIEEIFSE